MSDQQVKRGSLFSNEGLILSAIDEMAMPSGNVWYPYNCGAKNASIVVQCSGDVAMDMSLSTGDTRWTIKAGTALSLDAMIAGRPMQFRHHESTAQMLQVIRLV